MTAEGWESTREMLQNKLAALNEEIGSYPGPITGCDAHSIICSTNARG